MSLIVNQRNKTHAPISIPDEDVVTLDASDVNVITEDFSKSLIGRIMADRSFSFGLGESSFTAIWNYPEGLKIKSLGDNIYQFSFVKETDMLRFKRGSPWLFKQYLIHVQPWNNETILEVSSFSVISMWIQLWEMPDFCKTREAATKIGEKLGSICCGFLGHEARNCDLYLQLSIADSNVTLNWRTNLRADQLGWRVVAAKENTNPNSGGKHSSFNQTNKKPTPVSLIKSFASLSCKDKDLDKSITEENSASSIPTVLSPYGSQTIVQSSFMIGPNSNASVTRHKRQKLKHMARKGTSNASCQNITGLKRPTETTELEAEVGDNAGSRVFVAEGEKGANPVKAPTGQ
ncbi:hypothetical protein PIB30_024242 [Stylosanthes scabra]|uniref:DUF4283 domain-containing protein n=1 Tax=Stylosanthes scabra TaxID=79078 RepID=A0ABU6T9E9_9FABA|nr:hypothetical protein [Stylosanthes scabra]